MVALFVLLTIITLLTIDYFVQRAELNKAKAAGRAAAWSAPQVPAGRAGLATAPLDRVPSGVFLDPGHVWVQLEASGSLRVGADMFPAALLGRPDRIDVKPQGTHVRRGDPIAVLAKGRREIVLRSPVDGVITRVNDEAPREPERVQADPFGNGWLYWLSPVAIAPSLKRMLVAEEATGWARQQLARLRDVVTAGVPAGDPVGATLHDGGAPIEGISEHLDDAAWNRVLAEFFPIGH